MLLHDKPEATDIRFGHKVVSDWLAKQIESVKPPFRLAITGGLGTGKSTILQSALAQIEKEKRDQLAVAYVDVWKLDKDSVRRSALIRIAKDLLKDGSHIEKLRESLYGTFSEASYIRPFRKTIDQTGLWISGGIFAVVFFAAYLVLDSLPGTGDETWWWKSFVSALIAGFNLATKFLEKSIVHVQRTFNRAPMVGAEEFEEGLQKILDDSALANKQVVLLFDNIDRASPDSSRAILAGISAFFDHSSHAKLRNVLIIVPFDPSCLELASDGDRPIIDDCEKMFDAIVPLPKLTIEDLSDFAFDNLKDALSDFSYEEDVLRDLAYLVSFSPFRSPREIKHMVNQLFSRLDLARALESKVDDRLQSSATLLPQGTVTQHPDALLKLQICEKIFPEFTESVVNHGIDLKRAFDVSEESLIIKSDLLKDSASKTLLADFLNATTGIPKNPPQSAAPFLYMKGPDQVVSIPSGQLISDALYMNDAGKLKSAVVQADGKNLSHEHIANVVRFHRKKYAKNTQALKNAAKALFSGLSEVDKFEKILAIEVCEVLALVPDTLTELSPKTIAKHTNEYMEVNAVQKVWRILDAEFKKMADQERLNGDESALKWSSEYFDAVFKQAEGLKRSGLDTGKLPYALILTDAMESNLGEDYPGIYCRSEDVLESVKRYLAGSDQKNFEKYKSIIGQCFSSTPDFEGAEKIYQEISTSWQAICEKWLNGKDKALGEKLATVAYSWPGNSQKGKAPFEQIKAWIVSKVANFHQMANKGHSADVLDIILAFYSSGVVDGNFDNITQHTLGQINRDQFLELRTRYGAPNKNIWEPLRAKAQSQLIAAVDRAAAFDLFMEDKANNLLQAIITGFQGLTNKDALLDALLNNDVSLDSIKGIEKFPSAVNESSRLKFISLLIKANADQSDIREVLVYFVKSPDGSNEAVFSVAEKQDNELKKALTEEAIESLTNSPTTWTEKEARTFKWLALAPHEFLDVKLKDPIELGLERGALNGQDENVKSACTELVLHMWKNQHGFSEKSFKILKKSAPDRFSSEIEEIAQKYNVKESIIENLVDKVAETIRG